MSTQANTRQYDYLTNHNSQNHLVYLLYSY